MSLKNYLLQNMTFFIPLERKFDADQFLTKNLGLKMYGTEVMTLYNNVIVSITTNLSPLNIRLCVLLDR